MRKASVIVRSLIGIGLLMLPEIARGEAFVDFAIGGAFTENSRVRFDDGGYGGTLDAEFDDSFSTGVRGGYWFEQLPWLGVGGMLSYFEPDLRPASRIGYEQTRFGVLPVTALLMLRAPLLPSSTVPRGQFQPYLNVGPGAFISVIDDDRYEDSAVDVGVDVHAGATWMFTSRFGMFGEYRFTHYTANLSENSDYGYDASLEATLNTHHAMAGFAWHFD